MMRGKVMVVRDKTFSVDELREFLARKGYKMVEVVGRQEALSAYRRHRPQVVLLDVLKPSNGGLKTLRELKALDQAASIVVVAEDGKRETASHVMGEGAYEYITRPIDYSYLELVLIASFLWVRSDEPYGGQGEYFCA